MRLRVRPSAISGNLPAPPSKSYTHRAMILGLLAAGTTVLEKVLLSDDTLSTLNGIRMFGAGVSVNGDTCIIEGGDLSCPEEAIDVGNSGTTLRLLTGVASLLPCTTLLTGDESIQRRPMGPLITALEELGAKCVSARGEGRPPILIRGPSGGGKAHIRGDVSSQFISSLLISSPVKNQDTEIVLLTPLKSKPYVNITVDLMERFNVTCQETSTGFFVPGRQRYSSTRMVIPGDYSSAAFPLVAGALTGKVFVKGLDPESKQGDRAIVEILSMFGARVERKEGGIGTGESDLHAADIDMGDTPDLFPIVAVLATQAEGESRLYNAHHLRHKESDRIRTTVSFLRKMGADIEERDDGCVVRGPNRLRGADIISHGDHRILMAAAVAGLIAEGETVISDARCYAVSYPSFLQDMRALGADMEVID